MNEPRLMKILKEEEGFSQFARPCPSGKLSIGYGRNVDPDGGRGISTLEGADLLYNDVYDFCGALAAQYRFFLDLDEVRQEVLVAMAFQLGMGGLERFPSMLRAVAQGDFEAAAKEMLLKHARTYVWTDWHKQTPGRCERMAKAMETGAWPQEVESA